MGDLLSAPPAWACELLLVAASLTAAGAAARGRRLGGVVIALGLLLLAVTALAGAVRFAGLGGETAVQLNRDLTELTGWLGFPLVLAGLVLPLTGGGRPRTTIVATTAVASVVSTWIPVPLLVLAAHLATAAMRRGERRVLLAHLGGALSLGLVAASQAPGLAEAASRNLLHLALAGWAVCLAISSAAGGRSRA